MSRREQEHLIQTVYPGSIAEELEIEPGDVLLKINGQKIEDVFDYRYLMKDEYVEVLIRKPSGVEWLLEIDKDYDDELGVEFENGLMSEYRSCSNKCMFCFIDQMPPGMRETLYFKDDDSRLSFLQGNYITMTNMKQADIDRIIHMQLAPINISVQTTNPELRCKMLHNRFAGEKLKFLQDLYEAHIEMNGQIVLCKGVNDKDELKRSIEDLSSYLPFMRSVSVVPAGLTKYREGLYPLELFSKEEAGEVIDMIESYQPKLIEKIKEIISSQNPEMIVIGLPRNMDGSYGFRCEKCKQLGEELKKEIQNHVKRVTAPYKYPRLIEFVDEIPETISGKIRRVEIRNNDNKKE